MWLSACFQADPTTIEGAFDAAARAIEDDDPGRLFRYLDQRAQHALHGIHGARQRARALIEADYPPAEQARAVDALGDGAQAQSPAELFAMRCPKACQSRLGRQLGAPLEVTRRTTQTSESKEEKQTEELVVRTARGAHLNVFLGTHGWYGIVFQTEQLMAERDHASRELRQIQENAAIYRRRRALSGGGTAPDPAPDPHHQGAASNPAR